MASSHVVRVTLGAALGVCLCVAVFSCSRSDPESEDPLAAVVRQAQASRPDSARTKVIVFGVDGADLDILEPMVASGELPAFARILREGASAKLRTIQPILSPIIWTTIATGKPPDQHGIRDFVVRDPRDGRLMKNNALQRKCEAVWDIVGRYGRRVGVVGWLVTWPAEPVNGFLVSDRLGILAYETGRREDDVGSEKVYPETMLAEVESLRRTAEDIEYEDLRRFVAIDEKEFRSAYRRTFTREDRVANLRLLLATAETNRRVALETYRRERPDLFAVYFELVDAARHYFMPFSPPQREDVTDEDFARYSNAVAQAYRQTDRDLGELMEAADEDTVILVVSDHGFRSGKQRLPGGSGFFDPHGAQWHRPFGVFLAWGKGVKPGVRIPAASVFDVTPTILGLLGFPRAKDMRGRFLAGAFDVAPPEETVDTYESDRMERIVRRLEEMPAAGGEGEDDVELARLRSLGYIGERGSTSRDRLNLATFLMSDDRLDDAERELRAALEADPKSAPAHAMMGTLLQNRLPDQKGREASRILLEQAALEFRAALEADPRMTSAANHLARIQFTLGRAQEALATVEAASAQEPQNPNLKLLLAKILQRVNRPEDAEAEVRAALELEPDFPEARRKLGQILLGRQEFGPAEAQLRVSVELMPDHPGARNDLGVVYLNWAAIGTKDPVTRERRYDQAVATFDEIIARWPRYAKAYLNRAQVRSVRGQVEQALVDVERALEIDRNYTEALRLRTILKRRRAGAGGRRGG